MTQILTCTNRILLLSLMVLVSFVGFAKGNELNTVDDNGWKQGYWIIKGYMSDLPGYGANATVEEGEYVDNKKVGLWKKYYPNGNLMSEITYVHNRPDGAYRVYYENGQLEEQGNWGRNKNIGEFLRFHENGQKQQEFYFSDTGKRNGLQRYFHENGQLAVEVNIINGKESGVLKRYDPTGKLTQQMVLENGVLEEGSIRNYRKSTAKPPVVADAVAVESEPEPVKAEGVPNQAHDFKPNGHNILYNDTRQITQIGEFKNGRLWDGKWYRYNQDGILVRVEIYNSGRFVGSGVIQEE